MGFLVHLHFHACHPGEMTNENTTQVDSTCALNSTCAPSHYPSLTPRSLLPSIPNSLQAVQHMIPILDLTAASDPCSLARAVIANKRRLLPNLKREILKRLVSRSGGRVSIPELRVRLDRGAANIATRRRSPGDALHTVAGQLFQQLGLSTLEQTESTLGRCAAMRVRAGAEAWTGRDLEYKIEGLVGRERWRGRGE